MNPFSWHSLFPHRFGPAGFPAAVCEEYQPVAWCRDAATAEAIAGAAQHFFEAASLASHRRRMSVHRKKRPPATGLFDDLLAEELGGMIGQAPKIRTTGVWPSGASPFTQTSDWSIALHHPEAPDDLPFAVVERGRVIAWVAEESSAKFIATAGRRAVLDRAKSKQQTHAIHLEQEFRNGRRHQR